jgi:hypothetical protein
MGKKVLLDMSLPGSELVFSLSQIGHLKNSGMATLPVNLESFLLLRLVPWPLVLGIHIEDGEGCLGFLDGNSWQGQDIYAATEAGGGQWILILT